MSGPSSGQPSHTSTPSQPSTTPASTVNPPVTSKLSAPPNDAAYHPLTVDNHHHQFSHNSQRLVQSGMSASNGTSTGGELEGFRRHRQRKSGGFLLQSTFAANIPPSAFSDPSLSVRKRTKVPSSHPSAQAVTNLPKTPPRRLSSTPSSPLHASPLATHVTNADGLDADDSMPGSLEQPDHLTLSNKDRLPDEPVQTRMTRDHEHPQEDRQSRPASSGSAGLNADPAQIVKLALNLSESRRISANLARLPNTDAVLKRRSASAALQSRIHTPVRAQSKSPASQRHSRVITSAPTQIPRASTASPHLGEGNGLGNQQDESPGEQVVAADLLPHSALAFSSDLALDHRFSDATLARAAKARDSLELAAEYRRLLQHLPPLKSVDESASNPNVNGPNSVHKHKHRSQRHQKDVEVASDGNVGRPYNPLQCIRNRRFRARGKSTHDPEVDGWGDPVKVKQWIELVVDKKGQHSDGGVIDFTLPPFSNSAAGAASEQESPQPSHGTKSKANRSRMAWTLTPAEALADIYWVEQEDHKRLLEDAAGHKIAPLKQPRRGSPGASRERPSKASTDPPSGLEAYDIDSIKAGARLPTFFSRSDRHDILGARRGRHRQGLHDSIHMYHPNGSHSHLWHRERMDSDGSSIEDEDHSHKGRAKGHHSFEDLGTTILERQMMQMLEDEEKNKAVPSMHDSSYSSKDTARDSLTSNQPENKDSAGQKGFHGRLTGRDPTAGPVKHVKKASFHRASASLDRGRQARHSFDEADSTAPNSPTFPRSGLFSKIANTFVPSIALDLSPPESRSGSPSRKPLGRVTSNESVPADRNRGRGTIAEGDQYGSRGLPGTTPSRAASQDRSRAMSPAKKLFSRTTTDRLRSDSHRAGSRRRKGPTSAKVPESSRLRGMFRGGRLEETFSKVGDLVWRREDRPDASMLSSPSSSLKSGPSDSDADLPKLKSRATNRSDASRPADHHRTASGSSQSDVSPRYHMVNLPTFASPRRDERPESSRGIVASPTRLAVSQQQHSRSTSERRGGSGADLTDAPAKHVDYPSKHLVAFEPSTSDEQGRARELAKPFKSIRPALSDVRVADSRLNAVLSRPGSFGGKDTLLLGGAALDSQGRRRSSAKPRLQRGWSISDRGVSGVGAPATRAELARVRALLLTSGVKAQEITRQLKEPHPAPPSLTRLVPKPIPPAPRSQQCVLAGRILVDDVHSTTRQLEDAAYQLTHVTVAALQNRITSIRDRVNNEVTPLVRRTADEADTFSAELTTTHTLAVKNLNDSVDLMLRRRRRRFRWLRRGGFVLLEWVLLGVMWWAWFIVVLVRLVRGIVGGVFGAGRWLLCL
ncbi:MAG: hypothetical protein M1817_000116 [Caeruleum heppii]|nr:MAG: hypothetical protein M1817_000116 [Caeruleum heppii]